MEESFEKLDVWKRAIELSVKVHQHFRQCNDFSFRDQIQRASDSISNNIAEGSERLSPAEFRNFLGYAKGSAGEVRSQTILASKLGYLNADTANLWRTELVTISKMLHGLIRSLEKKKA